MRIEEKKWYQDDGLPTLARPATTIKEVKVKRTPTSSQRQDATWIPWLSWVWLWPPAALKVLFLWRCTISDMSLRCCWCRPPSSPLATSFLLRLLLTSSSCWSLSSAVFSCCCWVWAWIQCQKCLIGWLRALSCVWRSVKAGGGGGCCPSEGTTSIWSSERDCIRPNVTSVNDDRNKRIRTRNREFSMVTVDWVGSGRAGPSGAHKSKSSRGNTSGLQ